MWPLPFHTRCCPIQGPPKKEQVPTDGVDTLPVSSTVTMLRHVCKRRLKMEVEYGLKRGTTDNSYLIQVHNNALTCHLEPWTTSHVTPTS